MRQPLPCYYSTFLLLTDIANEHLNISCNAHARPPAGGRPSSQQLRSCYALPLLRWRTLVGPLLASHALSAKPPKCPILVCARLAYLECFSALLAAGQDE